ncbi:MAG: response regulator transcription factor [Elusimicrobiota bacterium]
MKKTRILVLEDDPNQAALIKGLLEERNYEVEAYPTVLQARAALRRYDADLLVLDRSLPDGDSLKLCQELRAAAATQILPILFLSARKSLPEKVLGLTWADDYMAKPFQIEELVVRIEALLRRSRPPAPPTLIGCGPFRLSLEKRRLWVAQREVPLTNHEFDLLCAFLERPGRVLDRPFLLKHVWGYGHDVELSTKAVDMAIVGLRRKLGRHGERIETVRSHGYRLSEED